MKFLLLSCSPRGQLSTSTALLEYLQKQLVSIGNTTSFMTAHELMRSTDSYGDFKRYLQSTDYFLIASPLYVDSLPSHILQLFEQLTHEEWKKDQLSNVKFIAIVNNGFPEGHQNQLALDICQQFANDLGLEWVGGIPIGGGAMLGGSPLENSGGRGRHARVALELLAQAFSAENPILDECIDCINKLPIPKRLYLTMAHLGWRKKLSDNNVRNRLKDQPYLLVPS